MDRDTVRRVQREAARQEPGTSRRRFLATGGIAAIALAARQMGAEKVYASDPRPAGSTSDPVGFLTLYGFGPASAPNPKTKIWSASLFRFGTEIDIEVSRLLDKWSDDLAAKLKSGDPFHASVQLLQYPLDNPPKGGTTFTSHRVRVGDLSRYGDGSEYVGFTFPT